MGIFFDLKKAFGSVNNELLINKLEFCGIKVKALYSIKSFISNRSQQVRLEGTLSDINTKTFSIPQGNWKIEAQVIGPIICIIFIIYINELLNLNLNADVLYYADDTVGLVKNKDYMNYLINNLQLNLSKSI